VGLFRVVEAVDHDGLIAFFYHFSHAVGGVFFRQSQAFGKTDAVAAEQPHDEQSAHMGVGQDNIGAIGEDGRVVVGAAGHIDGVSHRGAAG
jgi:hypothetical protein